MGSGNTKVGPAPNRDGHAQQQITQVVDISKKDSPGVKDGKSDGEVKEKEMPLPLPPSSRKPMIFNKEDHVELDNRAVSVPSTLFFGPLSELVSYLTSDLADDVSRTRVLFTWLATSNSQSAEQEAPKTNCALDFLRRIESNKYSHASFFYILCKLAEIDCKQIKGIKKGAAYEVGETLKPAELSGVWNAVVINGEWRLLDVSWAARGLKATRPADWATKGDMSDTTDDDEDDETPSEDDEKNTEDKTKNMDYQMNEFYFLTDPDELIFTHFPDDAEWQLLEQLLTQEQFQEKAYLKSHLFDLGMSVNKDTPDHCYVQTELGEAGISFSIKSRESKDLRLKYYLFKKKKRNNKKPTASLNHHVIYQKSREEVKLRVFPPSRGQFKLEIYGGKKDSKTLDLICAYIVECAEPNKNFEPLSYEPEIGWGPGTEIYDIGLQPLTCKDAVIETNNGQVDIAFSNTFSKANSPALYHEFLHKGSEVMRHAVMKLDGDEVTFSVRLPLEGSYALKILEEAKSHTEDPINVCNYLIWCKNQNVSTVPFPKLHNNVIGRDPKAAVLGIQPLSHKGPDVTTAKEIVSITFSCPEDKDFELWADLHSSKGDQTTTISALLDQVTNVATFDVLLRDSGEYGLDVFAKEKGSSLNHVHTYLIKSDFEKKKKKRVQIVESANEIADIQEEDQGDDKNNEVDDKKVEGNDEKIAGDDMQDERDVEHITDKGDESEEHEENNENKNDEEQNEINKDNDDDPQDINNNRNVEYALHQNEEYESDEFISADILSSSDNQETDYVFSSSGESSDTNEENIPESVSTAQIGKDVALVKAKAEIKKQETAKDIRETDRNKGTGTAQRQAWTTPPNYTLRTKSVGRSASLRRPMLSHAVSSTGMKSRSFIRSRSSADDRERQKEERFEKLRRRLQSAMQSRNIRILRTSMREFERAQVPQENNELNKASGLLRVWHMNEAIVNAMIARDADKVELAVRAAERAGLAGQLNIRLDLARRFVAQLRRLEDLKHPVLDLNQQTIAELKSYDKPPDQIYQVMVATLTLLGDEEQKMKRWKSTNKRLSLLGKMSVQNRVARQQVETLGEERAQSAKARLDRYSLSEVKDASAGAATFYLWSKGIVQEVLDEESPLKDETVSMILSREPTMVKF